jgi:hypothetical protein
VRAGVEGVREPHDRVAAEDRRLHPPARPAGAATARPRRRSRRGRGRCRGRGRRAAGTPGRAAAGRRGPRPRVRRAAADRVAELRSCAASVTQPPCRSRVRRTSGTRPRGDPGPSATGVGDGPGRARVPRVNSGGIPRTDGCAGGPSGLPCRRAPGRVPRLGRFSGRPREGRA